MKSLIIVASVLLSALFTSPRSAAAQLCSGTLTGQLRHAQRSGGWCDPALGNDCTGSLYPVGAASIGTVLGDVSVNKGIPEVGFTVRNALNQVVAQGVTDINGAFTVQWADFSNNCMGDMVLSVRVPLVHGGNRFSVTIPGLIPLPWTLLAGPGVIPRSAAITLSPIDWGTWDVPIPQTNIYTSAFLAWNNALRTSPTLVSNWVNMFYQFPSDGGCNNGVACSQCDEDERGEIFVDFGGAFDTFVVTHETGHTVSCAAHTTEYTGAYDYGRDGPGHTLFTQEYKSVTFEEGFSNFVAASALWANDGSVHPRVCNGAVSIPCVTNSFHSECVDHAFSFTNKCTVTGIDRKRQEATVTAYLWDLADSQVDSNDEATESVNQTFADVIATLDEYPQGYDNREENEHVCCAFWICGSCGGIYGNGSDRDNGRNVDDFNFHWAPLPFSSAHVVNCSP